MAPPNSFDLHELGAGVFAAIAPGTGGPAVGNAAIVDLGDLTLVFDTMFTLRAGEELAAAALRVTGRAASLVVNSHWHGDHVGANQLFAGVPIVGTSRMRELVIADKGRDPAIVAERVAALRAAASRMVASQSAEERRSGQRTLDLANALGDEAQRHTTTPPNLLIEDRLVVEGSGRQIELFTHGRGHTESDIFAFLPDSDVVLAGDLVWNRIHPKIDDGFPAAWAGTVARIADDCPGALVVPGHGSVGGTDTLRAMVDYQQRLVDLVAAVEAGDLDPADAAPPVGSEDWESIERFRSGLGKLAARPPA